MRRLLVLVVAIVTAMATLALPVSASGHHDGTRTYRVTITNLTDSQLMTPFVVSTHSPRFRLFRMGRPASYGLQQVAENGAVPVLVGELEGRRGVFDVAVAGAAPVAPGASVEVVVDATWWASHFSVAGMLICTNDGFGAVTGKRLPWRSRTFYGRSYDAGSEINTESYADLVPPCDALGQAGMSNPDLAQDGVVRRHRGIEGIADLDPATHGWKDPVIKITIARVES